MFQMFSLWRNCRNNGPSIYTLQGHKSQLWRLFLCLKTIPESMPGKIAETLHSWEEAGVHAKSRNNWGIVPASIW